MGALAGRIRRHRPRLAGAAAVALAAGALAAPAEARTTKVEWDAGGGLAALHGGLQVYTDRTATWEENGHEAEVRLTDRQWRKLNARLRASRFRTLERSYTPEPVVPDSTFETVRYRGRTVEVATGGDPPRRLERLLRHFTRLHGRLDPGR
jgi:hypothetical protein